MSTTTFPESGVKKQILHVTVLSPERIVFAGDAKALSSVNDNGPFDILPYHANLITIIKDTIIIHLEGNKDQKIPCERAIMKVFENTVSIFLGVETFEGK